MTTPMLEVQGLSKEFHSRHGVVFRAVNDVSFSVASGEVLGLVGESGSGKSTTARCVMRLIEPTSGLVHFDGQDIAGAKRRQLKTVRRGMQMVFQDPYSSLDPSMRVVDIISEGMIIHGLADRGKARRERVAELLDLVGLRADHLNRRPSDFSGGERQRIGIARALAVEPKLLICDEPVASLDVSIQAQILNLFKRLQRELNLTILFIAHDLATVRHLCDRVAVLKEGTIQEIGTREQVYSNPQSEYARQLLDAMPVPDPKTERAKHAKRRADSAQGASGPERAVAPPMPDREKSVPSTNGAGT